MFVVVVVAVVVIGNNALEFSLNILIALDHFFIVVVQEYVHKLLTKKNN